MFKRGDGPLISVNIATRGRQEGLCKTVDSLHSLAKDKSLIEYVFRVDTDDTETLNTVENLSEVLPVSVIIAPRGKGYLDTYKFIDQMAVVSRGDWLLGFNDDAIMLTQHWDQHVLEANPWSVPKWKGNNDVCLLGTRVIQREISFEFPLIRRKMFQILGHISPVYAVDAYLYRIMSAINAAVVFPVLRVSHSINDLDDQTKHEGKLYADKVLMPELDDMIKKYAPRDIQILRDYIRDSKTLAGEMPTLAMPS